jgi:hypothetical protein
MTQTSEHGWAGVRAQLHDAARAARQVAEDREPVPVPPGTTAVPRPRQETPVMPADPAASPQPRHRVPARAARQLLEHRRDRDHPLPDLPARAPARDLLARYLAEVRAGQDSRDQATIAPGPGTSR